MIYLLVLYGLITVACFFAGHIFYAMLPGPENKDRNYQKPLISYLLTGLMLITILGQWVVLVFPLNLFSLLVICIFLFFLGLVYRKKISFRTSAFRLFPPEKNRIFFCLFFILLLMILTLNAGPTIMDDTDSYHIQMIKWARDLGSIPGIANLHLRFGFNSSWFVSCALLSPQIKGINGYLALNGLLSVWISFYLLEKVIGGISKTSGRRDLAISVASGLVLLFCLGVWPMIRGNAATANYDFITTCCILALFIESFLSGPSSIFQEWMIWPVFLFTVRIINYPLLLLSLFLLFRYVKTGKMSGLITFALAGLIVVAPFLIRNTILSGYPLFPVYQLDLFSFDWKSDKQLVIKIVNYIRYFNRVNIQSQPIAVTSQLAFPNWTVSWYHFLFVYDKILTTLSICCYFLVFIFWKKLRQSVNPYTLFFLLVFFLQLISWFFIAPDPRFVYGPLLGGIFTIAFLGGSAAPVPYPAVARFTGALLVVVSLLTLFYTGSKMIRDKNYRNWLVPRAVPVPSVRQIRLGGVQLNIPEKILDNWNPRCYDSPLPCLYQLDPRLRLRGNSIRAGFKIDNQNPGGPFTEY